MLPAEVLSKNYNIIKPTLVQSNKEIMHLSQIWSVDAFIIKTGKASTVFAGV